MNRWPNGGNEEIHPEPAFQTEYEEDLLYETGQVSTSLGGETRGSTAAGPAGPCHRSILPGGLRHNWP